MISLDSVVTLADGFCCADRLKVNFPVLTPQGRATIRRTSLSPMDRQVYIETKHFSLIVSPDQLILVDGGAKLAEDVAVGDLLETSVGLEEVLFRCVTLLEECIMIEVETTDGYLISNGIYLCTGSEWQ